MKDAIGINENGFFGIVWDYACTDKHNVVLDRYAHWFAVRCEWLYLVSLMGNDI